jgi:hypothetical protein
LSQVLVATRVFPTRVNAVPFVYSANTSDAYAHLALPAGVEASFGMVKPPVWHMSMPMVTARPLLAQVSATGLMLAML